MDSLLFAFNAISPVVLMVAIGYFLKRMKLIPKDIIKPANRLIFHVFLPAMLFLNIYRIESFSDFGAGYIFYVLAALVIIFLGMIPLVMLVTPHPMRRGALLQATFRSNFALIGIPLAESLFGANAASVATLLSAAAIPMLNTLAVISLTIFRGEKGSARVKDILHDIVKNPLIRSIAAALLLLLLEYFLRQAGIAFRFQNLKLPFGALQSLSALATPMALLLLGAQFEFSAIPALKREIIFGTFVRTIGVPFLAIGFAYLVFRNYFAGAHFAAFVAIFATPVAVSSVPMAQELGSDVTLAGQLVVWTTFVSAFTVFLVSFFLRLLGVF